MSDEANTESPKGIWCVVANVKKEHPYGPGGTETIIGTRQFRGGTKVYIADCYPGTCNSVVAIGLHRKSRRFITCAVHVKHLENFRPKMIYQPGISKLIEENERCWIKTKDEAEIWSKAFIEWQIKSKIADRTEQIDGETNR